jgi:N6-adenosine-specific RNA methylase IME4
LLVVKAAGWSITADSATLRIMNLRTLVVNPFYDLLVIDPPYQKSKGGLRKVRPQQTRQFNYETMSLDDIFKLLDEKFLTDEQIVFMWTIDSYIFEVEQEMKKRGYKLHARMIWDKTNGVAPAFTIRYSHEYLLWFYKGKFKPVDIEARGKHKTVFVEPSRQHSRKPDAAYNIINSLYPDLSKIDVFSREKRAGYEQFGDQIGYYS